MEKIKVQVSTFEDGVRDFWNGFRKNAPFAFTGPVDEAYAQLDRYYAQLIKVCNCLCLPLSDVLFSASSIACVSWCVKYVFPGAAM